MSSKLIIYRAGRASESALALRNALREAGFNVKVNRRGNNPLVRNAKAINWGVSEHSSAIAGQLNTNVAVDLAIDKQAAFQVLSDRGVSIPEFDTELGPQRQGKWLARTEIRGSGGDGIVVIRKEDQVVDAPLYVQYVPKRHEYRVHVFGNRVIAVQQKRKREGVEQSADEALIRNAANDWVFCVDNVEFVSDEVQAAVEEQSKKAVRALGLDFAAIDIIVGRDDNKPYVLELNTAPGLESPTVIGAYVNAIGAWLNE